MKMKLITPYGGWNCIAFSLARLPKSFLSSNKLRQVLSYSFIFFILTLITEEVYAQQFDPGAGKTRMLIGQTFQSEYDGYRNGTGLTPQGSSHYATFYLGAIEQGDDNPNSQFIDYVRSIQDNNHALVALSFKDNTAAGGYGQMTDDSQPLNTNAVWDALTDTKNGSWDSQIDAFAQTMASRPDTRFYLRIGYEVSLLLFAYKNGNQYVVDWLNQQANAGINVFDNPDAIAAFDRQAYIDAYNYVANRIRNVNGVSNVDFVYHPVRGYNDTRWLYPGSQNVDWVAFSIFNNDVCVEVNGTFNCQGQSIDPQLQQSIDFAKQQGHEIMIAEAAVQAPASNSSSGFIDYLNRLHNVVVQNDVRVLAYINSNWPIHGWGPEWGDSRVESNSAVLNHWQNVFGNSSRYLHSNSTTAPSCSDGIQNGDETGVDCGGSCPTPCGGGTSTTLNFESGLGNWSQVSGFDTHDWTIQSGGTPSNNTGPSSAQQGNQYAYLETSSCCANSSGDNARLVSPTISGTNRSLSFYYHMLGSNIGSLNVDVRVNGSWQNAVWSISGSQGNSWNQQTVNLSSFSGDIRVRFRAVAAGGWQGDIAIDNISITSNNGGSFGPAPSNLTATGNGSSINLTWSDNSSGEDNFHIERSTGGAFSEIATVSGGTASFTDNAVSTGTTYSYRVRASDQGSFSDYSNTASATVTGGGNDDCQGSCPDSHPFFLCGQCYESIAQAQSAGCNETCDNPPPTCNDGIQNGDETGVDCGGSCPNTCNPPTCNDGIQNGDETGVDCGGSCPNTCNPPTCNDGIQNGDETGVDCGGSCPNTCPPGNLAFLEPTNGAKLLFIGQDLLSVTNYINNCGSCPTPGGITTYVSMPDILTNGNYGALGWTENDAPFGVDINWGAGPLNAYSSAVGFPNSAVQIGLWMVGITDQVGAGQYDAHIVQMADFFKSLPTTAFYLRIGYEFDGQWNGYNGNSYINAYRRIVDVLRAQGVNNVAYVWQSSTSPIDDVLDGGRENLMNFYPGDNYVDWFGMSWFLPPNETATVGGTPSTQLFLADEMVNLARQRGKPMMIAESAPQGYDISSLTNRHISPVWDGTAAGGNVNKSASQIWNEWFVPFFNYIDTNDDVIKAVSFINADWDTQGLWDPPYEQGYWGDTRIEANNTIENNWVNQITQSGWLHGSGNLNSFLNGMNSTSTLTRQSEPQPKVSSPIKLYPNPSSSIIHIQGIKGETNYVVKDVLGKQILQGKGTKIDISNFKRGLYLVEVENQVIRIIKE